MLEFGRLQMSRPVQWQVDEMRIFSAQPFPGYGRDLNSALIEMGHDLVIKSDEWSVTANGGKKYYEKLKTEKPGVNKRWVLWT